MLHIVLTIQMRCDTLSLEVMIIKNRFKELRKALNLSQDDFAAKLGMTRGAITNIEVKGIEPKPLFIDLVCNTYNVNKDWLLTGEGEMFIQLSRDEQIAEFVGKALAGSPDNIKRSLLAALVVLPESGWDALEKFVDKLIEQRTKKEATDE